MCVCVCTLVSKFVYMYNQKKICSADRLISL